MATTVATLAPYVENRVEEVAGAPVFWQQSQEVYTAIVEAVQDLLLLIGRPTQTVTQTVTLLPNTPWQPMPSGIFVITDMYDQNGRTYQFSVYDFDYSQVSWGSGWENDISTAISQWAPVGFSQYLVHPAVNTPQQVTVTGIQATPNQAWPYDGTSTIPFESSMYVALELYATSYLQFKEGNAEFSNGVTLYQQYLELAKRYTQIQDRRDPLIFAPNMGIPTGITPIVKR
jgi:hypothetical protein